MQFPFQDIFGYFVTINALTRSLDIVIKDRHVFCRKLEFDQKQGSFGKQIKEKANQIAQL